MSETITVFDIEILNDDPASVCSIGIVELKDLKIVSTYYSLIHPHNMNFDPYRYNVHHIPLSALKKAPSFKQVWKEIAHYFDHRIVVAHDIQNDMASIRAALKRDRIDYPTLRMSCTNVLSHLLEPQLDKYNVSDLCTYFNISIRHAHHALYDALACAHILIKLMNEAQYTSLERLHQDYHIALGKMKSHYYKNIISPEHATTSTKRFHRFTNLSIAFTGNMVTSKDMIHRQLNYVHAYYNRDVTSHTDYLVVGAIDFKKERYGHFNKKVSKALRLKKEGQDLHIIHENDYLYLLSKPL